MSIQAWLGSVLQARFNSEVWTWLNVAAKQIAADPLERSVFIHFSSAVRKSGKYPLACTKQELSQADKLIPGWQPLLWRTDHAARVYLLMHLTALDQKTYLALLDRFFQAADLAEAEALYLSLPLLAYPSAHVARASEGLRSNIKTVFTAVAHHSPYPLAHFEQQTWNQMVLKALFIESTLDPIFGLESRCNFNLTNMLCQYAHERWAASRSINIELWRCVGACPNDLAFADLERVLKTGDQHEQLAAALSLQACQDPRSAVLAQRYPAVYEQLTQGLCWQDLLANL